MFWLGGLGVLGGLRQTEAARFFRTDCNIREGWFYRKPRKHGSTTLPTTGSPGTPGRTLSVVSVCSVVCRDFGFW